MGEIKYVENGRYYISTDEEIYMNLNTEIKQVPSGWIYGSNGRNK
jgi:hypothetical protein